MIDSLAQATLVETIQADLVCAQDKNPRVHLLEVHLSSETSDHDSLDEIVCHRPWEAGVTTEELQWGYSNGRIITINSYYWCFSEDKQGGETGMVTAQMRFYRKAAHEAWRLHYVSYQLEDRPAPKRSTQQQPSLILASSFCGDLMQDDFLKTGIFHTGGVVIGDLVLVMQNEQVDRP